MPRKSSAAKLNRQEQQRMREISYLMQCAADAFRKAVVEPLLPLIMRQSSGRPADRPKVATMDDALRAQLEEASRDWEAGGAQSEPFDTSKGPVAEAIKKAARAMGKSQKEIAQELGVSPAVVSRVLANPEKSRIETLDRIGKAVGVRVQIRPAVTGRA